MLPDIQRTTVVAESQTPDLWKLPESLLDFVNTGDEDMVAEILTLFQQDSAERLRELNLALSNGDRVAIRKQAHTLKGAASQVGAMALAALCQEIEIQAEQSSQPDLLELACRAWECYGKTCREMTSASSS